MGSFGEAMPVVVVAFAGFGKVMAMRVCCATAVAGRGKRADDGRMVYRKPMGKDGVAEMVYPSRRAAADDMSVDTHTAFEVVTQCRFVADQVKEFLAQGRCEDRGENVGLLLSDLSNLETAIDALVRELVPIDKAYIDAMDEEEECPV